VHVMALARDRNNLCSTEGDDAGKVGGEDGGMGLVGWLG